MAEPYETNKVSLPPMTPFGVAYQEYIRKGQDPAAGSARAKQKEMDKEQGPDWDNPELMRVPPNPILTRPATHKENEEFANTALTLAAAVSGAGIPRLAAGEAAAAVGALWGASTFDLGKYGADYLDKIGRTVPDTEKMVQVYGTPTQAEEQPVQDRRENMMQ